MVVIGLHNRAIKGTVACEFTNESQLRQEWTDNFCKTKNWSLCIICAMLFYFNS